MSGGQDWAAEVIDTSGGDMSESKRLSDEKLSRMQAWMLERMPLGTDDARKLFGHIAALEAELAASMAECERLISFRDWICHKLKLPENATDSDIYGKMHVLEAHAHGYEVYITSHRCNDKQGEIARQSVEIEQLKAECERLRQLARLGGGVD